MDNEQREFIKGMISDVIRHTGGLTESDADIIDKLSWMVAELHNEDTAEVRKLFLEVIREHR